ncbi:hypothetical protein [Streptomyces genisteinicus]|uniref:Uncharacterized protein n=1 Tax=Streptomyces genisteinicus TaxID=2768068 RepID=A0A7H0I5A0_9ACTN|nr:hypothetical protein [Streptomyces genisteinicus]QNP67966.1 hypothetical protein IAG43_33925 [Streptomyces genisteinicus]
MPLDTITPDEMRIIITRIQPYLPRFLTLFEPGPHGVRFAFAQFTGRELRPVRPAVQDDANLRYVPEDEDPVEHRLRNEARHILDDVWEQAGEQWAQAAYVAELGDAVKDAPARWKTYRTERRALDDAFAFLRDPAASAEWPSALSRLIDAQDRTRAAATAFDTRAREIARVHDEHHGADITHDAALAAAGYPEAAEWPIARHADYDRAHHTDWGTRPLAETVRHLIEQQDTHITKINRLSGTAGR